ALEGRKAEVVAEPTVDRKFHVEKPIAAVLHFGPPILPPQSGSNFLGGLGIRRVDATEELPHLLGFARRLLLAPLGLLRPFLSLLGGLVFGAWSFHEVVVVAGALEEFFVRIGFRRHFRETAESQQVDL